MANIPVVYYQFDRDQFYGGAHSVQQGYFDYRRDGFGPVVATENECINELKKVADRNFTVEPKYASLISRTFPMADGHCCERVYEEISKL